MRENACAEELLEYAPAVLAVVQKLDPSVINIEKTEKWCKLRVHGVALDRYMSEGGLDLAKEEIELMTGPQLPYAPRWIKGDTLGERFDSGSIKRSTLVLTVKSKRAADTILAKGLSFGGRRHEAERFWEKGEDRICLHCYDRGHFGKCTKAPRCFVCAGGHEGSEHQCEVEGCNGKAEACKHQEAKCVKCKGPHLATSQKCPERRATKQTQPRRPTEISSSPPRTEIQLDQDRLHTNRSPKEMTVSSPDPLQASSRYTTIISSDIVVQQPPTRNQSLPRLRKEPHWLSSSVETLPTTPRRPRPDYANRMLIDDDSTST
jgi:hypothetical protein